MAAGNKRAKKMLKRALQVGVEEAAAEFGVQVESLRRSIRSVKQKQTTADFVPQQAPVLIIPDLHAPYNHPDALAFLRWVYEQRGCGSVVSVGDLFDFHSMSRFVSETDAMNATREYNRALEFVADLTDIFPEGDIVLGNHDLIPQRQLKELGIPASMLHDDNRLYGLPPSWRVHDLYHVIEPFDVLVEHGIGSGGKYGCANTATAKRCSYVQGHTHSAAAVIYNTNHQDTIFGMNVGCLVDSHSLAMRYGRYGTKKGVLGCGVVYNGSHAEFVPFESWSGR